ncbi:Biopolymer transport protein ExbB [Pseudomonas sp. 8AS]|uniref:tonB-system energizer ExbB n=1 Tax=Pseudomonas sp. 8AS TaxID=2653163 RepID=UPI0012F43735|nr:tonB-system energizer ExbB [Pseudomonas sp. 8AS]VXB10493.1 Biopolymer transport protein ExbB [Pseudomonas sp. 8AS]
MNPFSQPAHSIAATAQVLLRRLALALFGLLLPVVGYAEEVPAAPAPAVQQSAPATASGQPDPSAAAPAASADPRLNALREKIAALGEQASAEQIGAVQQQFMQDHGIAEADAQQLVAALQALDALGQQPAATEEGAHDLSPWGMYQNADVVVKTVMIGLMLASVLTWTIWIAKSLELVSARRRLQRELLDLKSARNLNQAAEQARAKHSFSALLIDDAREELKLSAGSKEKDGIKERVSFRLERLVAACGREMSKGTGVLATIGSTAPFVGLFGTVWGIMNSFIGIAKSQTTNLAVVAPGIAEALLATALGLVAAIPAVIIYNVFARSIASYKAQVADASAQVLLLVSRDLDLPAVPERSAPPHMVKAV